MNYSKSTLKVTLLVLLCCFSLYGQDKIFDINGRTGEGKLITFKKNKVVFQIQNQPEPTEFISSTVDKIITSQGIVYRRSYISQLCGEKEEKQEDSTVTENVIQKPEEYQVKKPVLQKMENAPAYYLNPCEDDLFLKLRRKDLDSLSEREYAYFLQKDKDCSEWLKQPYGRTIKPGMNQTETLKPQTQINEDPMADYYLSGKKTAESKFQSQAAFGGIVSGFAGGLIGWTIGYSILSGMDVDVPSSYLQNLNVNDQREFQEGYKSACKEIRKRDFNTGAVIGTIGIVAVYLISSQ